MSSLLKLLVLSALAGIPDDAAGPDLPPAVHGQVARAVQAELDARLFPGAVVLVGTPDRVLYHEAFGWARVVPRRVPMRRDSVFDIASVTKVVCTGTAVGILHDRGQIHPDAPLTKYLPDHQGRDVDRITLRHLGAHLSGFPDNPRVSHGGRVRGEQVFEQLLLEDPSWPVGSRYQYACRNTIVLSTMIERITGRTFADFCTAEILQPLEMNDSVFTRIEPTDRVVATHHPVLGEDHNADGRDAGRAVGNAGLFSSALDLANFCRMMLNDGDWKGRRLLSPATIADFTSTVIDPKLTGRAFIWEVDRKSVHRPESMSARAYGHAGSTGISLWIDPELRVYTLVMTNRNHPIEEGLPLGVTEPKDSPRGIEQYKARSRIADAALAALGVVGRAK